MHWVLPKKPVVSVDRWGVWWWHTPMLFRRCSNLPSNKPAVCSWKCHLVYWVSSSYCCFTGGCEWFLKRGGWIWTILKTVKETWRCMNGRWLATSGNWGIGLFQTSFHPSRKMWYPQVTFNIPMETPPISTDDCCEISQPPWLVFFGEQKSHHPHTHERNQVLGDVHWPTYDSYDWV